jgi:hypothetical protein
MTDFEVNYGELGPVDFDRFGTREERVVRQRWWMPGPTYRTLRMVDIHDVYRRLELTVHRAWRERGRDLYMLSFASRAMEVKQLNDDRLEITLDGHLIFREKVKYRGRHGERIREIVAHQIATENQEHEEDMLHYEAIKANAQFDLQERLKRVRAELDQARQAVNTRRE